MLASLVATLWAMYCEWSVSLPTASCCHSGHPVWLYPPPPRGISDTRHWSERWVRTCTSAPGNASPQRSRKVPSEGFIQRCSALGGNRLHWWLIYRINTKGIGFLSPFFTFSPHIPSTPTPPCAFFSVREAPVHTVKQSLNIFSDIFAPVKSCFFCVLHWAPHRGRKVERWSCV